MASLSLARLVNRKILRISGPDCYPYLQGLVSNDVRYLYEPDRIPERKHATKSSNVLSTFMLNAQGRAICDMIIYRTPSTKYECEFTPPGKATEPDELLIECDSTLASGLANTLYGYRVRRKISITMENNMSVWCLFPNKKSSSESQFTDETAVIDIAGTSLVQTDEILSPGFTAVVDPRLSSIGLRIISSAGQFSDLKRSISSIVEHDIQEVTSKSYTLHRYKLGVGEGVHDHPESNCLPLECNGDFLNSVSFTKGCYLGQELTARIHYTGVVRKRLMPIVIDLDKVKSEQSENFLPPVEGSDIVEEGTRKKIGTLRRIVKNRGLALLRHDLLTDDSQLTHEGTKAKVSTYRPYWWEINSK